jgi:hypothetical protein
VPKFREWDISDCELTKYLLPSYSILRSDVLEARRLQQLKRQSLLFNNRERIYNSILNETEDRVLAYTAAYTHGTEAWVDPQVASEQPLTPDPPEHFKYWRFDTAVLDSLELQLFTGDVLTHPPEFYDYDSDNNDLVGEYSALYFEEGNPFFNQIGTEESLRQANPWDEV